MGRLFGMRRFGVALVATLGCAIAAGLAVMAAPGPALRRRHGDGAGEFTLAPRPCSRQLVRRLRRAVQPARLRGLERRAAAESLGSGDQGDGARAAVRPGVLQQHRVDVPRPDGLVHPRRCSSRTARSATIEIAWQGGTFEFAQQNMPRFADVLADLLQHRGIAGPLWVSLYNEPNAGSADPPPLRADLSAARRGASRPRRARSDPLHGRWHPRQPAASQTDWYWYMATHMGDLLDAWAPHIYWDFWDTTKIDRRLTEVRAIWARSPSRCAGRSTSPSSAFAACGRSRAS